MKNHHQIAALWIRIRIDFGHLDTEPDLHWEYGSGSRWAQWPRKRKQYIVFEMLNVFFWGLEASPVAWTSFLEAQEIGIIIFLNFWSKYMNLFANLNLKNFVRQLPESVLT